MPKNNDNTKTYFIYGLIDPRTGEIVYVGLSTNPKKRKWQHHYKAPTDPKLLKQIKQELSACGLVLEQIIFDSFDSDLSRLALEIENMWMVCFQLEGKKLLNFGGKGYMFILNRNIDYYKQRIANLKQLAATPIADRERVANELGLLIDYWQFTLD